MKLYRGLVAVILASAIGLSLLIAVALAAIHDRPLGDNARTVLIAIIAAAIGALGGYNVGRRNGQ